MTTLICDKCGNEFETENWDTEETARIIANDEGIYQEAVMMARRAENISELSEALYNNLSDSIESYPYSDIDMDNIDWDSIASEYMEV